MKIVISVIVAAFLFVGCSEDSAKKIDEAAAKTKETVTQTQEVAKEIAKSTNSIVEQAKVVADKVVEASKEVAVEAQKVADETIEATKKTINEAAKEVQDATTTVDNGKTLYKACAGCHGASGEKAALGKSQVIQAWSAEKTEHALSGYKDGSYGGAMKGLMKGQVSKLSDSDIKAVSEYISKL